jgi:hypothetical protein
MHPGLDFVGKLGSKAPTKLARAGQLSWSWII